MKVKEPRNIIVLSSWKSDCKASTMRLPEPGLPSGGKNWCCAGRRDEQYLQSDGYTAQESKYVNKHFMNCSKGCSTFGNHPTKHCRFLPWSWHCRRRYIPLWETQPATHLARRGTGGLRHNLKRQGAKVTHTHTHKKKNNYQVGGFNPVKKH